MLKKIFCIIFLILFSVNAEDTLINPVIADLKIDTLQIFGQAKGFLSEKDNLEQEAVNNALKNGADALTNVSFLYETQGDSVKVSAAGFPAYYTNFRSAVKQHYNINFYFSAKYQYSILRYETYDYDMSILQNSLLDNRRISHFPFGLNMEFGTDINGFFISGDFGGGIKNFGVQFSLGGCLKFGEKFRSILGWSVGFWNYMSPGHYSEYDFNTAVHGPFGKLLFGKDKKWFEIKYRFLLGDYKYDGVCVSQISAGFTYIKTKKERR